MGYYTVKYDSRVVIYKCKMFIRLATVVNCHSCQANYVCHDNGLGRRIQNVIE